MMAGGGASELFCVAVKVVPDCVAEFADAVVLVCVEELLAEVELAPSRGGKFKFEFALAITPGGGEFVCELDADFACAATFNSALDAAVD